jgi:alpha-N-arabinofuranosidase
MNLSLLGFGHLKLIDHQIMGGDYLQARVANTFAEPNRIKPRKGSKLAVVDQAILGELPAFSYSVVRLSVE